MLIYEISVLGLGIVEGSGGFNVHFFLEKKRTKGQRLCSFLFSKETNQRKASPRMNATLTSLHMGALEAALGDPRRQDR